MEQEQINTIGANDYARNTDNSPVDIELNWGAFFANYRVKKWRRELKQLVRRTNISFSEVCDYIGIGRAETPGFYKKLPKTRESYIGIGMAYKQDLDTINRWIVKYGGKRKLYIKDAINDLVWIYLINANHNSPEPCVRNYYLAYEECNAALKAVYHEIGEGILENDMDTVVLDKKLKNATYDLEHSFLKSFIKENILAFESAYAKPRKVLKNYVTHILQTKNDNDKRERRWTLNSLRGYLDDSMINYLSGSEKTVEAARNDEQQRTMAGKHIPANKRTHISLCLALGMTVEDINTYLELMGYSPLDGTNPDEGQLMNLLEKWESSHPLQRSYKKKYFENHNGIVLSDEEELEAVDEMLQLRRDLKEAYEQEWHIHELSEADCQKVKKFPYLKD